MPAPKDPEKREAWLEKMRESMRKARASMTPEQRSEYVRKGGLASTLAITPEQASEYGRRAQASLTPEQRSDYARRRQALFTPEQRRENAKKAALSVPPEQRREMARKRQAILTPEQRQKRAKKAAGSVGRNSRCEKALLDILNAQFPDQFIWNKSPGAKKIVGFVPDFIHRDQKLVVDMFGSYWHGPERTGRTPEEEENRRVSRFNQHGYECIVIWERELRDPALILEKFSFLTKETV